MKTTPALVFVLLSLYFAQGLPSGFITQAMPALLRQEGFSRTVIGFFGLLLLPWTLKFLWAPWVDRYYNAAMGQSRSWIVPISCILPLLAFALAWFSPATWQNPVYFGLFLFVLFVVSLLSATQDIAIDGLAVRQLSTEQRGLGNSLQIGGYRAGLIVGGAISLLLIPVWGWFWVFVLLGIFLLFNALPILFFTEKTTTASASFTSSHHILHLSTYARIMRFVQTSFLFFRERRELIAWFWVLLFYKVADQMASPMVKPMMVDMGYTLKHIGLYAGVMGSLATIVGAGLAYVFLKYVRAEKLLLPFNALLAFSFIGYAYSAYALQTGAVAYYPLIFVFNFLEHVPNGMAYTVVFTVMMHYCRAGHEGSDFTVQVCLFSTLSGILHVLSGWLADMLGYMWLFIIACGVGVVCLYSIRHWRRLAEYERRYFRSLEG